jgi:pimeloyl-ACP methyl ester carboxylesterase
LDPVPLDLRLASGSLHALRWGGADGPAVLCVPGLSANARSFDVAAAALAARGRSVVALDLRGRGRSPASGPGTYGWPSHAADVLEVADRLRLETFDVVGHSMGAFVAMEVARASAARLRRVVLVDAVGPPEPAAVPAILASVQRLGVVYPSADAYCALLHGRGTLEPWDALWKGHSVYELEELPPGVRPRTSREAVLEDMLYGASHDARALWPVLRMPTLLVRATRPLAPAAAYVVGPALRDEFAKEVPAAAVAEVDANHYGIVAHGDALRAIDAFLSPPG